jgi:hypothetical protein
MKRRVVCACAWCACAWAGTIMITLAHDCTHTLDLLSAQVVKKILQHRNVMTREAHNSHSHLHGRRDILHVAIVVFDDLAQSNIQGARYERALMLKALESKSTQRRGLIGPRRRAL